MSDGTARPRAGTGPPLPAVTAAIRAHPRVAGVFARNDGDEEDAL